MEGLTRLVSESLARHGFDRPLDYRRLQWSRWFRCHSHHSLLFVPSKPGVFALAEEVMDIASQDPIATAGTDHVGMATSAVPRTLSEAKGSGSVPDAENPGAESPYRMLAVTHFLEADDMAFVLDRMLSRPNPMRARLESGRYFVRFVVIEDSSQRRTICSALNQWMVSTAEKATGIGSHFASSLELTPATEHVGADAFVRPATLSEAKGSGFVSNAGPSANAIPVPMRPSSGAITKIHCPPPFPSGF